MQLDKTASEKEWLIYQRLARRAKNGYKVPEGFLDCAASFGQFFVKDPERVSNEYNL